MSFADSLRPCPRCRPPSPLREQEGAFLEAICERCLGRFLPLDAREALFAELRIDEEMLREMLGAFAGERISCSGCGFQTTEIRLRGQQAHFCTGCGGCWLDQGDLSKVTDDRVREVGVTGRDPSLLPAKAKRRWLGLKAPQTARGYRAIQFTLLGGWLAMMAGLKVYLDFKGGLSPALRFLYIALGTSAYSLWFLPTLIARRKKTLIEIFLRNTLSLLLPLYWPVLFHRAVIAKGVEEPEARSKLPAPSRAIGTAASNTKKPSTGV